MKTATVCPSCGYRELRQLFMHEIGTEGDVTYLNEAECDNIDCEATFSFALGEVSIF